MTVTDHPRLVAAVLTVVGVAAAAVEPADEGPGTLRLHLEPGADEVGVAGQVDSLLRSRFGLAVDARALAPAPPEVTARVSRPGRLVIERVGLVSAALSTSVSVVLALDGRSHEGTAEGTSTAGSLHRSVAGATLRAVEAVIGGVARFDVEHVEIATTGPDRTALVVVTMVTDRATQQLSGASVVREDVRQAVVRAVLAAVNRRLEPMLAPRVDLPT